MSDEQNVHIISLSMEVFIIAMKKNMQNYHSYDNYRMATTNDSISFGIRTLTFA